MNAEPEALVRLFPLPNLVLFPHVAQPLHIFEPRYRQLLTDSLADDRQIAMACLRPGWETDYENSPPIHSTVCLGAIQRETPLPDGRYNLWLHGRRRARILEEIPTDRLYRTARVRLLADHPVCTEAVEEDLARRLGRALTAYTPHAGPARPLFEQLLRATLPLGAICDILAFGLPLDLGVKQELLEETHVERRASRLLEMLEDTESSEVSPRPRPFRPNFSDN